MALTDCHTPLQDDLQHSQVKSAAPGDLLPLLPPSPRAQPRSCVTHVTLGGEATEFCMGKFTKNSAAIIQQWTSDRKTSHKLSFVLEEGKSRSPCPPKPSVTGHLPLLQSEFVLHTLFVGGAAGQV